MTRTLPTTCLVFSLACCLSLGLLSPNQALGHSAMFPDNYKYDDTNEGISTLKARRSSHLKTQQKLTTSSSGPAADCISGMASNYPCRHISLQAFMPKANLGGNGSNLNDIWGWTDLSSGREIAIVGKNNGVAFVDVTTPDQPVILGFLPSHNNGSGGWRDVKIYNDHAFIVADGSGNRTHGLQVFELTQLLNLSTPGGTLTETAQFDGFGNAHNIAINEDTGFAYVVGANRCSGGLYMVNISDPARPSFAGCFSADGYTHDAQCVVYQGPDTPFFNKEICVAYNEDSVTIVDVSDKNNPRQLSRTTYSGSRYTHQGWFFDGTHSHLITNDELDEQNRAINTTSYVFDVSSLQNPRQVGTYVAQSRAIDHNLYTKDNYIYESNYRSGLRVLKVNDIATADIFEVAYFDTIPGSDSAQFSGVWSSYIDFASGNIVASDIGGGLFVLKPDYAAMDAEMPPGSTPDPTPSPPPDSGGDQDDSNGGGGAFNLLGLLLIGGVYFLRRRSKK